MPQNFPFDPLFPGTTSIFGHFVSQTNSAGGLGACAVKMAGAEHGKADVGEGRMAASEGASGGEYVDEGQDRRGGKKFLPGCFDFLRPFAKAWCGVFWQKEKIFRFEEAYPDSFEGCCFYLRSLSPHFIPLRFPSMFMTLRFFFPTRRYGAF